MREQAARLLSAWWTLPDSLSVTHWLQPGCQEATLKLWRELVLPGAEAVADLYAALVRERESLRQEYESLFVGPGPVPCPPYEAVWRTDRPRHEEGTVTGEATEEVLQLYASFGLKARSGSPELPDHVAVELEALAYAWETGASPTEVNTLAEFHLAGWIPSFCASVIEHTESDFYKVLATLTRQCVQTWAQHGTKR